PVALASLRGCSLVERVLRMLPRLGFCSASVPTATPEIIPAELGKHSWAREQVVLDLVPRANEPLTAQLLVEQIPSDRFLIIPGHIYCDARLLASLCAKQCRTALVDSDPPAF